MFEPGEVAGRDRRGSAANVRSALIRLTLKGLFFFAKSRSVAFRAARMQIGEEVGGNFRVPASSGCIHEVAPIGSRN